MYKDKYVKYKHKYLKLKALIGGDGDMYGCDIVRGFGEKCIKDEKGTYETFDECDEKCTIVYIDVNSQYKELRDEVENLSNFIRTMLNKKFDVYLKGGSVIGLLVAKLMGDKLRSNFEKFLELDLIKDWDFTVYTEIIVEKMKIVKKGEIDPYPLPKEVADELKKNMLKSEGATIGIVRYEKKKIVIGTDYQYEISVKPNDAISDLEIPMTSMKVKITTANINTIFALANQFFRYITEKNSKLIDIDFFIKVLKDTDIIINKHENGLFIVDTVDYAGLSSKMISCINGTTDNINERQFLVCQITEPDRLFVRLLSKNIKKSDRIYELLGKTESWLLSKKRVFDLCQKFLSNIGKMILEEFVSIDETFRLYTSVLKINNVRKVKFCEILQEKYKTLEKTYSDNIKSTNQAISKEYTSKLEQINKLSDDCKKMSDNKNMVDVQLYDLEESTLEQLEKDATKQIEKNIQIYDKSIAAMFEGINIRRLIQKTMYDKLSMDSVNLLLMLVRPLGNNNFFNLINIRNVSAILKTSDMFKLIHLLLDDVKMQTEMRKFYIKHELFTSDKYKTIPDRPTTDTNKKLVTKNIPI